VPASVRTYSSGKKTHGNTIVEEILFGRWSRSGVTLDQVLVEGEWIPRYTAEFWTSRQRQASSLHEISYRACFKPQLPRFFIERLSRPGDLIYDPFMGRGTTLLEAALLDRKVIGNDINRLSKILLKPRFHVPDAAALEERVDQIPLRKNGGARIDLSMFYHVKTEAEIVSLRNYLAGRRDSRREDHLDGWIRMVATNRLTGHSAGFFSVYTLPPNQAASPARQRKINRQRRQSPEYRDVKALILRKSRSLLRNVPREQLESLHAAAGSAKFYGSNAWRTPGIPDEAVQLTVTSPPFLDTVNYSQDNWLRCWFNGLDQESVERSVTVVRSLDSWCGIMGRVFAELHRITRPGGYVAFEVGEIRKRNLKLDEVVVPLGRKAGFQCVGILVNKQSFTKTSNIWGVKNNRAGTNTNRIVLFFRL
jgi:hypothetical protein